MIAYHSLIILLTFPVNVEVRIISFPHHHWILQSKESGRLVWVYPSQVQTPSNLVREVLEAPMRDAVVEEEDSSERYLTGDHILFEVDTTRLLNLLVFHLNVPSWSSTANVFSSHSFSLPSRYHLVDKYIHKGRLISSIEMYSIMHGSIANTVFHISVKA